MASILLVEDNDDHALLAEKALLQSPGMFVVDRARSADECMRMLAEKHYDAVLLDYRLPKRNGLDLLREIKSRMRDVAVVMITSQGDEKVAVESIKQGAYDYVSKTQDYLDRLPLVIQKAIRTQEIEREKALLQAKIEESETRLRNIFENVEVGLIELDRECRITYANPKARSYLHANEQFSSKDICAMFSGSKAHNCKDCEVRKCFESGCPTNLEVEFKGRHLSVSMKVLKASDIGAEKLVAVIVDMTEQKKIQQQLIQNERIAVLGRMASGVAHKFNNILAIIIGQAEITLSKKPISSEECEKCLKIIHKVAMDGSDTIKRLQEFTRISKRGESTPIKVDDMVYKAIRMTELRWRDQNQYEGKNINIVIDLDCSKTILGNELDLVEAITNVIFNALDAMPSFGTLTIKTFSDSNNAYISVSDTGPGIDPKHIPNIFDPFFTTKGPSHTGLGLSVTYGIVNRHNGKIEVQSTQGKGTTFTISIPIYNAEEGTVKGELSDPTIEGKLKILVIDDEEMIRDILEKMLVQNEHIVTTASNGFEGIEAFRSGHYDVVFTDLGMPDISGWEVAKAVKKVNPQTPIVMITGWGLEISEEELSSKGVDFVMRKPFKLTDIQDVIAKVQTKLRQTK